MIMQILDGRKTDSATGQRKCVQGLDKNADKKDQLLYQEAFLSFLPSYYLFHCDLAVRDAGMHSLQ